MSKHFSMAEFVFSDTAARKCIDNSIPAALRPNAEQTLEQMERARVFLGNYPIHIHSGYRCKALNDAINGSHNSAHMFGWAVDFTCRGFGDPKFIVQTLAESALQFDQLIVEAGSWVHISFAPAMRRKTMTMKIIAGRPVYTEGIA